ncbi:MAG: zeta toxin family protein [Fusobacterium sp.]|nr:zeta toxin family protein [Fusobacterium sp.]
MQIESVKNIFEKEKNYLLKDVINKESKKPIAIILGGQPASGKGSLTKHIEKEYPNRSFLVVNGDLYRFYHPNSRNLIKDFDNYSKETQIFSNVFTEQLIKEAIKNKYDIIVEGTMRNPKVPLNTALDFKNNGFIVEAHAIATPGIVTELGLYNRFTEELQTKGVGRLADIDSHNMAVKGVPKSLDNLYDTKTVDRISIYNYLGKEKIKDLKLENDKWSSIYRPSYFVNKSRKQQLNNKSFLEKCLNYSKKFLPFTPKDIKSRMEKVTNEIENTINKLNKSNKIGLSR